MDLNILNELRAAEELNTLAISKGHGALSKRYLHFASFFKDQGLGDIATQLKITAFSLSPSPQLFDDIFSQDEGEKGQQIVEIEPTLKDFHMEGQKGQETSEIDPKIADVIEIDPKISDVVEIDPKITDVVENCPKTSENGRNLSVDVDPLSVYNASYSELLRGTVTDIIAKARWSTLLLNASPTQIRSQCATLLTKGNEFMIEVNKKLLY